MASNTGMRVCDVIQMMKMFILLLISFVLLMSPYRWIMFIRSVKVELKVDRPTGWGLLHEVVLIGIFSILYFSNSIVNPFLYNVMAKRFRSVCVACSVSTNSFFDWPIRQLESCQSFLECCWFINNFVRILWTVFEKIEKSRKMAVFWQFLG